MVNKVDYPVGYSLFVDRLISVICACVRVLKEKRFEISTPNVVHVYSTAGPEHALALRSTQKVKDQGHGVMKCAAGVGMHVDMTTLVL